MNRTMLRNLSALVGVALLAACKSATVAPPTPRIISVTQPAPAPLRPQVIPYRPVPPGGASPDFPLPAMGADGVRMTVISHMNPLEAVWNFRAAWNVAALNCQDARYQEVLDGYKLLLTNYERRLAAVNRELDQQYRREHGGQATRLREAYMTQVYNFFAMPPIQSYFCDATLQVARGALAAPPDDLDSFALANIQLLAGAFEQFYRDFEQYQVDVAVWDAEYGPLFQRAPVQAGVTYANATVTEAGFDSSGRVQLSAPAASGEGVSQPVIQPLPQP